MITSKSKMDGVYFFDPPSNTVVYGGGVGAVLIIRFLFDNEFFV